MKSMLRLLLLACLLPVLPAFAGEPAAAPAADPAWLAPTEVRSEALVSDLSPLHGAIAQSCNSVCWNQYQQCLNGCHGQELCSDYCREAKIECSCNCGVGTFC